MTNEKLQELNQLNSEITKVESQIRTIDELMTSCRGYCKIMGTPRGKFGRREIEYSFYDKEYITNVLTSEKIKHETKLLELKEQFKEL